MEIPWGVFWKKSRKQLKIGWLITASLVAMYVGAIQPMEGVRGISSQRAVGLATSEWEPIALWQSSSMWPRTQPMKSKKGVIGGIPGGHSFRAVSTGAPGKSSGLANEDRKTVRSSSMEVVAKNPRDSSETIRQLAERAGGFLVSSDFYGSQQASSAALQIRVPENKFEEVRAEIRKLGLRVESEKLQSEDVTKQYVDEAARLRNLHAQETQYLGILKQAKTVKDTLEVSDQLNRIRQEIEQQQAEFEALSKQVETVALTIALRAEADARVFGLNWRPLYQLKLAARQGLESLGDYASAMGSFLFYLPTVLLWLATILIGAAIGWRILRWSGRLLFMPAGRPV
jgi:molecular chaperone GrpE (heat shock protein)